MFFLFPFRKFALQSNLSRFQLQDRIAEATYTPGKKYKKGATFYGFVTDQEFELESLKEDQLSKYVFARIRGVENETYLLFEVGNFKRKFSYLLLLALSLTSLTLILKDVFLGKLYVFETLSFWVSMLMFILLCGYLWFQYSLFKKTVQSTEQFFCTFLEAIPIDERHIPRIFKL